MRGWVKQLKQVFSCPPHPRVSLPAYSPMPATYGQLGRRKSRVEVPSECLGKYRMHTLVSCWQRVAQRHPQSKILEQLPQESRRKNCCPEKLGSN